MGLGYGGRGVRLRHGGRGARLRYNRFLSRRIMEALRVMSIGFTMSAISTGNSVAAAV